MSKMSLFYTVGDKTVPVESPITVALKWAYEFKENVSGAHPIEII
jgi:hypothetical protein